MSTRMAYSQPPPYRSEVRSIYTAAHVQSTDAAATSVPSTSWPIVNGTASSAQGAPQQTVHQQDALLAQAYAHSQQIAWYNEQLQQLRATNETLFAAVKGMTISQAGDQRRIAEVEARLQEADSDDDPLSALELLELRRWKRVFCEGQTRSLLNRLEKGWETEREMRAENERLRTQLSKQ
jgi:hypothetical protein